MDDNTKPLEFVPADRDLVWRIQRGIDRHLHHRNLADNWHRRHTDIDTDTAHDKTKGLQK